MSSAESHLKEINLKLNFSILWSPSEILFFVTARLQGNLQLPAVLIVAHGSFYSLGIFQITRQIWGNSGCIVLLRENTTGEIGRVWQSLAVYSAHGSCFLEAKQWVSPPAPLNKNCSMIYKQMKTCSTSKFWLEGSFVKSIDCIYNASVFQQT